MEQESVRRDVDRAYEQVGEYFEVLAEDEKPRYILVSDFQTSTLRDSGERSTVSLALADLARPQGIGTGAVQCLAGRARSQRRRPATADCPASGRAAGGKVSPAR